MPLRASDVAFGNDVYCVNDVTPDGVVGKHHIIATIGSNIIMSEANNITFAQAKTSFFYRPKVKRKYNTLHLAGKEVCKKDEENLVLFELNIKLLYGRCSKRVPFFIYSVAAITALMVCMRFSASSKTMDCADSKTSSVTSIASMPNF